MPGKPIKLGQGSQFDPDAMLLVFTHIPKSGGTSFHAALNALSGKNYCHLVPGQNDPENIDALWGIGGHFDFESPSVVNSEKDRVYVSLLRHPVERFVSFYKHVMARPFHHVAQANPDVLEMEPLEFAKTLKAAGNREVANLQCRMLCGKGEISAERAIEHVKDFYTYCAPLSDQQQTVNRIAGLCGVHSIAVQRLNVAKRVEVELDQEMVEYVSHINADDMKLFEYVEQQAEPVA